jgi:ribosome-binding ATPase YchF (GTP1/OBG family)
MIIGLVGKPSSGKSTMFKALTLADVAIAPYPFTTIAKNEGVGFVKVDCADQAFNQQCNPREGYCVNHKRFIPVRVIDVAGLVPEAHAGKGMGMQFLEDLRPAHVLVHVVDTSGSTNERGEPVDMGSHDPIQDIIFLETELNMWYLAILKKGWDKFSRAAQQKKNVSAALGKQLSGLNVTEDMTKDAIRSINLDEANPIKWSQDDLLALATELRKRTKPIVIAANKMDLPSSKNNLARLQEKFPGLTIIPVAADLELALREASKQNMIEYIPGEDSFTITGSVTDGQRKGLEYIQTSVLDTYGSTGVQNTMDKAVFDVLQYMVIFPGGVNRLADKDGNVLPDAFLLPHESTALDFAFKIHTDLGNGFIKAIDAKTKKAVGKDHLLKHTDVLEIVSR